MDEKEPYCEGGYRGCQTMKQIAELEAEVTRLNQKLADSYTEQASAWAEVEEAKKARDFWLADARRSAVRITELEKTVSGDTEFFDEPYHPMRIAVKKMGEQMQKRKLKEDE